MACSSRLCIAADRGAASRHGSPEPRQHLLRTFSHMSCWWARCTAPFSTSETINSQGFGVEVPRAHSSSKLVPSGWRVVSTSVRAGKTLNQAWPSSILLSGCLASEGQLSRLSQHPPKAPHWLTGVVPVCHAPGEPRDEGWVDRAPSSHSLKHSRFWLSPGIPCNPCLGEGISLEKEVTCLTCCSKRLVLK